MCKNIVLIITLLWSVNSNAYAQTEELVIPKDTARQYSHWTVGIAVGEPFMFCNLTSWAARKTYFGVSAGVFGGYQFNPVIGLSLLADYGTNKAGAHSYALERKLGPDGTTYYLPTLPGASFRDIYSKITFLSFGLQASFNVNRILFQPAEAQRFTVLVQPGVYMQHFKSVVCNEQGQEVTDGSLNGGVDFGLGGELALRARINSRFDMQLSSGIIWTANNTFDGVNNLSRAKDDYVWSTKVALIYKINRRSKGERDNVMYQPAAGREVSSDLAALLAEARERELRERELLAQLEALQEKLTDTLHTRMVDTVYIVQKETLPANPVPSKEIQEEWILSLIGKIRTEQPDIIEEVGYDTLVKQVIEAREEYGGYFSDDRVSEKTRQNATPKFAVQIYAMTNPFPASFFKDTPGIRVVRLVKDKLYRYLYGVYDTMEEARAALPEVQKKYWDAFVREFDDYMIRNALILDMPDQPGAKKNKRR